MLIFTKNIVFSEAYRDDRNSPYTIIQGRNEVYIFVADPVFLRKFLIPDPKSDENFDPWSHKI